MRKNIFSAYPTLGLNCGKEKKDIKKMCQPRMQKLLIVG